VEPDPIAKKSSYDLSDLSDNRCADRSSAHVANKPATKKTKHASSITPKIRKNNFMGMNSTLNFVSFVKLKSCG
jgi:hypothetical protein